MIAAAMENSCVESVQRSYYVYKDIFRCPISRIEEYSIHDRYVAIVVDTDVVGHVHVPC